MAASSWKGYITFGLVSIPVSLTPAARTERISFNQLHSVCHNRLKQPLFCPHCDRLVDRSEVEKGYEYEKDQYLLFSQAELKNIEPESARSMTILEFVKLEEIDPVYFDACYYAAPKEAGHPCIWSPRKCDAEDGLRWSRQSHDAQPRIYRHYAGAQK